VKAQPSETRFTFQRRDLLRWLYLGRVTVASGILAGAFLQWFAAEPEQTLVAVVVFLASLTFTSGSAWYTHLLGREAGDNFFYGQVIFDALLVTAIVHVTGGGSSPFVFLYILVISAGSLLLPLPGGFLLGVLATILFFADTVALHFETFSAGVLLQVALFATVAVITGLLGDRVRRAGLALGEVESALRQLRLDHSEILENIGTGVLTVDGEGRLVYLNPAGESLLGLPFQQWRGADVLKAVDEMAPGMGTVLRTSVEKGLPVVRFKTVTRKDGLDTVLGVSTTVPELGEGVLPSVTAIFQDITDQERMEALHRRNERLEAVEELSASLAHEIKNPLASIRSAVEQLSGGAVGGEDRSTLERLVVTESERLSRLLSEFIEFSALKMGHSERVDLASLAKDCMAMVRQHPEVSDGVRFKEVGLKQVVNIPGDMDLLHRALFNLLLNAAQHAGPAGVVRVEIQGRGECVAPPGSTVTDPVCLAVADSGPGVDPGDLPRIFDPFFTGRPGGSGLGLALVHRAVEAHKGAVLVDQSAEGGAEFTIYLPGTDRARAEELE
jgi:two-component system sensor histidine kinase PilS (NtrC family)